MEMGLKNAGESGFATISSSKLLAVPYAFMLGQSKIVDSSFTTDKLTQNLLVYRKTGLYSEFQIRSGKKINWEQQTPDFVLLLITRKD
jgi:hypothetical protein